MQIWFRPELNFSMLLRKAPSPQANHAVKMMPAAVRSQALLNGQGRDLEIGTNWHGLKQSPIDQSRTVYMVLL